MELIEYFRRANLMPFIYASYDAVDEEVDSRFYELTIDLEILRG